MCWGYLFEPDVLEWFYFCHHQSPQIEPGEQGGGLVGANVKTKSVEKIPMSESAKQGTRCSRICVAWITLFVCCHRGRNAKQRIGANMQKVQTDIAWKFVTQEVVGARGYLLDEIIDSCCCKRGRRRHVKSDYVEGDHWDIFMWTPETGFSWELIAEDRALLSVAAPCLRRCYARCEGGTSVAWDTWGGGGIMIKMVSGDAISVRKYYVMCHIWCKRRERKFVTCETWEWEEPPVLSLQSSAQQSQN